MKTYQKLMAVAVLAVAATGCTRVQTGDVGVRIGWDKQIQQGELMPGSFNQTLIGDVLMFPVKNVNAIVEDLHPVAKDNSTMKDFDLVVVYKHQSTTGERNLWFHESRLPCTGTWRNLPDV